MKRRRVEVPPPGDVPDDTLPDCVKKGFDGQLPKDRDFREGGPNHGPCKPCTRLLWFEPESIPKNFAAVLYGQRRTGKTTWLTWLLWSMQYDYDRVVCFSSTNFKGEFQKFMNPKLCFHRYEPHVMQAVLDVQAATPEAKRERVLVILDDVLDSETEFRKRGDNPLVTCYSMGRHYNISVIMCTQYAKCIPTSWRRNVDFAVVFYTFSSDMADIYYKEYGALLGRSQFMSILSQCTTGHQALVIRPCTKSRQLQDFYQLTEAPAEVPKFYIGKPPPEEIQEVKQPTGFPTF